MQTLYLRIRLQNSSHSHKHDCVSKYSYYYFTTKIYVVVTQKNRLKEAVLLIPQNMLKLLGKKIITNFTLTNLLNWTYEKVAK